jgi:RHS repeat-associated protein
VTSGSTVNYVYDAAGNVTNDGVHTYQYDSENRIVSVDGGSTANYAYDNQNRRYKKTIGSAVTHYIWQGSKVLSEHNGSTGAVLIDYVYSGGRMIAKVASGTTQYFLSDRLSVRLSLDTSGNVIGRQGHLPFGEDFGESGTQDKHHFTSYQRDGENGLDYAVNRAYAPNVGRFQQADPYRASGYKVDPRSWNRYSYARNNPLNRTDRVGLQDENLGPCWRDENGMLHCPGVGGSISINGTINSGRGGGSGAGSGDDQIEVEQLGDAGTVGEGQGATVEQALPPLSAADRTRVSQDLNLALILAGTADCDTAMQPWGIDSLAVIVAGLELGSITTDPENNQIPSGNIFDGRTSQSIVTDEHGQNVTIEAYFRAHRNSVTAITTQDAQLVFLGPKYFREKNEVNRAISLIHEAIHRAGLPDTAFGATQDEGSENLTNWIRDNCHL